MSAGLLDFIDTPAQGNVPIPGVPRALDNGCFGKGYPGDPAWFAWLLRQVAAGGEFAFAVAPDVVGQAGPSLERSLPWLPQIRDLGLPAALVAQNGLTEQGTPWAEFDVLFIGGCVECPDHGPTLEAVKTGHGAHQRFFCPWCEVEIFDWKLGPDARCLVAEAKGRGKRVHMGRVNSGERFRYARLIGCDSVDGTILAKYPDKRLPDVLAWVRSVDQLMFEGVA